VTPRSAAGKLTISSPPVLVEIASQEPGCRERPAERSNQPRSSNTRGESGLLRSREGALTQRHG
jgi:hypothetical protein